MHRRRQLPRSSSRCRSILPGRLGDIPPRADVGHTRHQAGASAARHARGEPTNAFEAVFGGACPGPLRAPERFGNWNRVFKNFGRWGQEGIRNALPACTEIPSSRAAARCCRKQSPSRMPRYPDQESPERWRLVRPGIPHSQQPRQPKKRQWSSVRSTGFGPKGHAAVSWPCLIRPTCPQPQLTGEVVGETSGPRRSPRRRRGRPPRPRLSPPDQHGSPARDPPVPTARGCPRDALNCPQRALLWPQGPRIRQPNSLYALQDSICPAAGQEKRAPDAPGPLRIRRLRHCRRHGMPDHPSATQPAANGTDDGCGVADSVGEADRPALGPGTCEPAGQEHPKRNDRQVDPIRASPNSRNPFGN